MKATAKANTRARRPRYEGNGECAETLRKPEENEYVSGRGGSALRQAHFGDIAEIAQLGFGGGLDFLGRKAWGDFAEVEALRGDVNDGELRDDGVDAFERGERIRASFQDFWGAIFRGVLHGDDEALGTHGDVHRAADSAGAFCAGDAPVGEIAFFGDLQAAEDADIEMAAARHHMRVHLGEKCGAGAERDGDFHGVHEIEIFVTGIRARAHAENSIFAVKVDCEFGRDVGGDEVGNAPAEIYVSAVGQFERGAGGDLFACEARLRQSEPLWLARCGQRKPRA